MIVTQRHEQLSVHAEYRGVDRGVNEHRRQPTPVTRILELCGILLVVFIVIDYENVFAIRTEGKGASIIRQCITESLSCRKVPNLFRIGDEPTVSTEGNGRIIEIKNMRLSHTPDSRRSITTGCRQSVAIATEESLVHEFFVSNEPGNFFSCQIPNARVTSGATSDELSIRTKDRKVNIAGQVSCNLCFWVFA